MRDALIILGIFVAALIIGVVLYSNNIGDSRNIEEVQVPVAEVPTEQPASVSTGPVAFSVLGQGTRAAGVSERKNIAVRSDAAFADLWNKVHGQDGEVLPSVDFDQYQVIGVFAGVKQSGGYAISVVRVVDTASTRTVTIAVTSPGEGCTVTQALTNPYQLIRLPASNLTLKREYIEEIRPCQ